MTTAKDLVKSILTTYFEHLEQTFESKLYGEALVKISVTQYFAMLYYKNGLRFTVSSVGTTEAEGALYGTSGLRLEEGEALTRLGAMFDGIVLSCGAVAGKEGAKAAVDALFSKFDEEWRRVASAREMPDSVLPKRASPSNLSPVQPDPPSPDFSSDTGEARPRAL